MGSSPARFSIRKLHVLLYSFPRVVDHYFFEITNGLENQKLTVCLGYFVFNSACGKDKKMEEYYQMGCYVVVTTKAASYLVGSVPRFQTF